MSQNLQLCGSGLNISKHKIEKKNNKKQKTKQSKNERKTESEQRNKNLSC